QLEIDNPDMDVRRDAAGKLYVAGIPVPDSKSKDNRGTDWLLSQREIVIRHGTLRWNDEQRGAPELPLSEINLELRNHWHNHQFAVHATPPAAMAAPIDFRADFNHPVFADSIADATLWNGQLYLDLGQTDLAVWSAYIAFPKSFAIERGHGALRAWLDFDRAKVANLTADISLAETAMRFNDLPVLELDKVSGRIGVKEEIDKTGIDGTPTLGAHGHSIALTNFSFVTNDGMALPPTSIAETFEPAVGEDPAKTTVSATLLDLQTMATFASRLPFSPQWRQILADYDPRGQLHDFTASWQGSYPAVSAYQVKGDFAGLSLKGQAAKQARPRIGKLPAQAAVPFIPGFDNLTGHVEMNERGGDIALDSNNLQIELPGVFTEAMVPLQKLAMQANWSFQDKNKMLFSLASMDLARDGLGASASGTYLVTNTPGAKASGFADFSAHIDHFEMNKIEQYLPADAEEHFRDWITHALLGGTLRDATIKLKGDIKDFPFHTNPGEKSKGEFTAEGRIVGGVLNYDSHPSPRDPKKPMWPWLEDIQGTIKMDRTRLEITAEHAKTHNAVVAEAKAVIDEVASPKGILTVDATINAPMPDYLAYIQDSPVQQMIGGFTDEAHAAGPARLSLKLSMPLSHMVDSKVSGKLQFQGDDIALFAGLPPLNSSSGALEFSERGFNINNVHSTFLGGPATISGGGPGDTAAIRGEGTLTAEGVRKFALENGFGTLAQHMSGSTRYTVAVNVRKKHTDVIVDSNLNGMGLDLPAPLHKEAGESLATRFEMLGLNSADANLQREEVKIALGTAINARYEREKSPERNAPWRLARGTIGVFAPTAPPPKGVLLNLSLRSLNVDAWNDLITAMAKDKAPANVNPGGGGLADLFNPDTFAIRASEMTVFNHKIENVVLNASRQNDIWQAKVGSAQAAGNFSYSPQGKGLLTAKLDSLSIPKSDASDVADLLEGKNVMQELPALDIEVQNFDLLDKHLGKLVLKASNGRKDGANVWSIDDLEMDNP
ncbi:MAG: TIGR02099 family protein, partial [Burkholderiaceae bacterium]|nr:TIGR02099 family protein [Burkholderiaceae bacterium]